MKKSLVVLACLALSLAIIGTAAAQPRRTPTAPEQPALMLPPGIGEEPGSGALVTPEPPSRPGDNPRTRPERPTAVFTAEFDGLHMEDIVSTLQALDPTALWLVLEERLAGLTEAQLAGLVHTLTEGQLTLTPDQITELQALLTNAESGALQALAVLIDWLQDQGYSLSEQQIALLQTLLAGGAVTLTDEQIDSVILFLDTYTELAQRELRAITLYLQSLSFMLTPAQIAELEAFLTALGVEL